jgi:phage shock protein PspC (stress-responsive transcriptional regulator)
MTTAHESGPGTWHRLRNLALPAKGAMVGRVCAAFGKATVIPAWMWRVGFCTAVLCWGTGIVAYFVLVLCIPDETPRPVA